MNETLTTAASWAVWLGSWWAIGRYGAELLHRVGARAYRRSRRGEDS